MVLTFASSPTGLQLAVDAVSAATPFTRTVIVGSSNSVSAPSPQTLAGVSYAFSSWSDGGAQTHTILAPAIATTYTARYATVQPRPAIAIDDVSVVEGDRGTVDAVFTVSLSVASTRTVRVRYATSDGTAHAGHDYTATAGTLTFRPGVVTRPIGVPVYGEHRREANETFYVNLSVAVHATIADSQGLGTIVGDDRHSTRDP